MLCIFCNAITYGDVSYDYMQDTFTAPEEQRNNFAFDEEKENMFRKKATGCWVKEDRTSAYFLCFKISDTFK